MKISEAISKLKTIRKEHGDVDLFMTLYSHLCRCEKDTWLYAVDIGVIDFGNKPGAIVK